MEIDLTGHHIQITDALREHITEKFTRLERHLSTITSVHVILTVEKLNQQAEAKLNVSGGQIFADANSEDMYAAIDLLVDKLDRQLIKHKEKHAGH